VSHDPSGCPPGGLYYIHTKRGNPLKIQQSAVTVDFFPVGTGKRFVQRVVWHPGAETEMTSFRTVTRSEAMYDANQRINNGGTLIDFNLDEYSGKDYSPLFC